MNSIPRWWQRDASPDCARSLIETAHELLEEQKPRIRAGIGHARLFAGLRPDMYTGFAAMGFADVVPTVQAIQDRYGLNIIRSVATTYVSQVAKEQIKVTWLTNGGSLDQQRRAKVTEQFTEGCFHTTKFRRLAPTLALDAAIYGTSAAKIYGVEGRMHAERVFPFELLVDDLDARYGEPHQLLHRYVADRQKLLELYKKSSAAVLKAIESATPVRIGSARSRLQADMVEVVEGWHLPSSSDSNDGRHVISCNGQALCDEPWKLHTFPFAIMRFTPGAGGFWGSGLPELLKVLQGMANEGLLGLMDAIGAATLKVLIDKGAKITKSQINNRIGDVWEFDGGRNPPRFESTPPVFQQFIAYLDWIMQQAYAIAGISQMSAQSIKPAGLNSGRAMRAYADVQTTRLVVDARSYESLHVDAAVMMRDVAKEMDAFEVTAPYQGKLLRVKSKDATSDEAVCIPWPTNLLPSTPEGKLDAVIELSQAAQLSPKKTLRLLDYPDLESVTRREYAAEDAIDWMCDQVFTHKVAVAPNQLLDLPSQVEAMKAEYARAMTLLEPGDERLDMAETFIEQALALIKQNQPAPEPMPAAPAAPMANPHAPPVSDLLPVGP